MVHGARRLRWQGEGRTAVCAGLCVQCAATRSGRACQLLVLLSSTHSCRLHNQQLPTTTNYQLLQVESLAADMAAAEGTPQSRPTFGRGALGSMSAMLAGRVG